MNHFDLCAWQSRLLSCWPSLSQRRPQDRDTPAWIDVLSFGSARCGGDPDRGDFSLMAEAGFVVSYGADLEDLLRSKHTDRILGKKGWHGWAWPKGGPGWNAVQRHLFEEECALPARRASSPSAR